MEYNRKPTIIIAGLLLVIVLFLIPFVPKTFPQPLPFPVNIDTLQLDTEFIELDNQSLFDVFESPVKIQNLVTNRNISISSTGSINAFVSSNVNLPANNVFYVSYYQSNTFSSNIRNTPQLLSQDNTYSVLSSGTSNYRLESGFYSDILVPLQDCNKLTHWGHTLNPLPASYIDYMLLNITTLINNKQKSPMFNTTFDLMTDEQRKLQLDDLIHDYGYFDTMDLPYNWVDIPDVDIYYNLYLKLKQANLIEIYEDFYINKTHYIYIPDAQASKQYSPLFNTTFDLMSYDHIKIQLDSWFADKTLPK